MGDSHACAVSGRLLTVIHLGQPPAGASSRSSWAAAAPFLEFFGASGDEKFRASLGMPIFFIASLVPRLENIVAAGSVRCRLWGSAGVGLGQWREGWSQAQPYGYCGCDTGVIDVGLMGKFLLRDNSEMKHEEEKKLFADQPVHTFTFYY